MNTVEMIMTHAASEIHSVKTLADAQSVCERIFKSSPCRSSEDVIMKTGESLLLTLLVFSAAHSQEDPFSFIKKCLQGDVDQLQAHLIGDAQTEYEVFRACSTTFQQEIQGRLYGRMRAWLPK